MNISTVIGRYFSPRIGVVNAENQLPFENEDNPWDAMGRDEIANITILMFWGIQYEIGTCKAYG